MEKQYWPSQAPRCVTTCPYLTPPLAFQNRITQSDYLLFFSSLILDAEHKEEARLAFKSSPGMKRITGKEQTSVSRFPVDGEKTINVAIKSPYMIN